MLIINTVLRKSIYVCAFPIFVARLRTSSKNTDVMWLSGIVGY